MLHVKTFLIKILPAIPNMLQSTIENLLPLYLIAIIIPNKLLNQYAK
jgi:hypothetical protein